MEVKRAYASSAVSQTEAQRLTCPALAPSSLRQDVCYFRMGPRSDDNFVEVRVSFTSNDLGSHFRT